MKRCGLSLDRDCLSTDARQWALDSHPLISEAVKNVPRDTDLRYEWTASTGDTRTTDQPLFQTLVPPRPLTVSVIVRRGNTRLGFGTITVIPLASTQVAWILFWCALRELLMLAVPPKKTIDGVGDRSTIFVDPLLDPLRALVSAGPPLHLDELNGAAERLLRAIAGLNTKVSRSAADKSSVDDGIAREGSSGSARD